MKPMAMASTNADSDRTTKRFLGSFIVSVLVGIGLLGALVYTGGVWNILANTRILALLMDAGIVSYTDVQAGFIEGVPNHEYYLKSQEPVSWVVVLVVIGIFLTFFLIKAIQFHGLAQHYGIKGSFGQHARIYMYGQAYEKVMPFQIGKTAAAAALHRVGASLP
ncbi:MAG: hypothetical protein GFH27_549347n72 [Chloroflexi bacterium AL-W]|nr:hypothetical protein [Chloroflexi bacterium AL-N1]NOK70854.1 hypothetical protein [Chloroflexi bacterium AL-N10]NOK78414.1 hypothetical protein [Chloroflexi bacterium AL-N5]NOK85395.1 hypothetical protein [Chloroflexi bacterium AL-W]NOK92671.1 hypothetical protein [Chloroflexi bacterium AL-N15]